MVITWVYGGPVVTMQEFSTAQFCEAAQVELTKQYGQQSSRDRLQAFCVRK
jgi:hypothetical protein